jgi:phospholipase C
MPPPITNVVVLMFENRSYDNVLGMLYNAANAFPYKQAPSGQSNLWGLSGTESNPQPSGPPISVSPAVDDPNATPPVVATTIPVADPGEPFADMAQQILGLADAPTTGNPYQTGVGPYGSMQGFVANYAGQTNAVPAQIMMYMTPELMPISAFLANNFMVCDGWFGSVPTQTFANRLYSLCACSGTWMAPAGESPTSYATSFSYIDDKEYTGIEHGATPVYAAETRLDLASIFSRLDDVLGTPPGQTVPNWKLYFHDFSNTAGLLEYVHLQFDNPTTLNLGQYDLSDYTSQTTPLANKSFSTFQQDLDSGNLAPFTLIEPRYSYNYSPATGNQTQSNHPGTQGFYPWDTFVATDTFYGELLLLDVYTLLYNSKYWPGTLLIVVYDEHGGCYDHLPPVTGMAPPSPTNPPSYVGFDFTVSGARVPAIIVSPFAKPGSTLRASAGQTFDHTSIIKTVWQCFNLGASLNDRDAAAPSILDGLSDTAVNDTKIPPTPVHPG